MMPWFNSIIPLSAAHVALEARWKAVEAQLESAERACVEAKRGMGGVSEVVATGGILSVRVK